MTDPNNLEGTRTREELAENFRELERIAPTPSHKFALMFGQKPETHTMTPTRYEELEDLTELIRLAASLNRGNRFRENSAKMEGLAEKLMHTDFRNPRASFLGWLRDNFNKLEP